jgi:hypothetical protein
MRATPVCQRNDKRKRIKGYLNGFLSTHINPQAKTASTTVLGSGMLATRNPKSRPSLDGIKVAVPEGGQQAA